MHFIHEQDGMTAALLQGLLGLRDGVADVFHPGQYRGQRHELGIESRGHQPRQRGLAHARRTPQNHGMQFAGPERKAQRLAFSEQMRLTDDFVDIRWSQAFGERRGGFVGGKQVRHL